MILESWRQARWPRVVIAGVRRWGRVLRVTAAALAALGLLSFAIIGGEEPVGAQEAESTGVGISLDGLSNYPTHLTVDGFMVELSNLTATETYQVTVSSDSANVGIGGCGTSSQTATVTDVEAEELALLVYACTVGEVTVTAEVRLTDASSPEASVSQQLMVEALPEIVIGPSGERIRTTTTTRGPRGAVTKAVPKAGTPGIVPLEPDQEHPHFKLFDPVTATSVRANWLQPSDGGGAALTGYGLLFWPAAEQQPDWSEALVRGTQDLFYDYTNLEPNTRYKFRIHACNGEDSCGYWTDPPKQVRTLQMATPTLTPTSNTGRPVAPHTIKLVTVTERPTSLKVTWRPSSHTGGRPLTRFQVRWREGSGTYSATPQSGDIDDATKRVYEAPNLRQGIAYVMQVRSCDGDNDATDCSDWSAESTKAVPGTSMLASPANLAARPLSGRTIRLEWDNVTNADNYLIKTIIGRRTIGLESPSLRFSSIDFDPDLPKSDDSSNSYTATAVDIDGDFGSSNPSMTTVVSDPIARINGAARNSNGRLVAEVTWSRIDYANSYTIHYRKLRSNHKDLLCVLESPYERGPIEREPWEPIQVTVPENQPLRYTREIGPLDSEAIYGVYLTYTKDSGQFGSAREAFVWASDRSVNADERIATIPLSSPINDRTYSNPRTFGYNVCFSLFDQLTSTHPNPFPNPADLTKFKEQWTKFIDHALGTWQMALDGLIVMDSIDANDAHYGCADYSRVLGTAVLNFGNRTDGPVTEEDLIWLYDLLNMLDIYTDARTDDAEADEVVVINYAHRDIRKFREGAVFGEVSENLGFAKCVFYTDDGTRCAVPSGEHDVRGRLVDILFPTNSYTPPPDPVNVRVNQCLSDSISDQGIRARFVEDYSVMIHKPGHALGLNGDTEPLEKRLRDGWWHFLINNHSTIQDSVMSFKGNDAVEVNLRHADHPPKVALDAIPVCGPYPLDVMAVYALHNAAGRS